MRGILIVPMPDDTTPPPASVLEQAHDQNAKILADLEAAVKTAAPEKAPDPWMALKDLEKQSRAAYAAGDFALMQEIDTKVGPLYDQEVANIEKNIASARKDVEEAEESFTGGKDDVTEEQVAVAKKNLEQWEAYNTQFTDWGQDFLSRSQDSMNELKERKEAKPMSVQEHLNDLDERIARILKKANS
jgi:hypothetical protein